MVLVMYRHRGIGQPFRMIFGNYWYHSNAFDIVADGPSDVLPQGLASLSECSFEITGTFEKKEPEVYTLLESMKRWKI